MADDAGSDLGLTWTPGRIALYVLFWLGWAIVLAATFMINHFDLFGLRQVYLAWRGQPYTDLAFRTSLLYRLVRHPILLGFVIAFWATPTMTALRVGHNGLHPDRTAAREHDLNVALGDQYREYRSRVPMLIPGLRRLAQTTVPSTTARPA